MPIELEDMLVGLKTDDIDLGAIGDLLMRGKGYEYNLKEAGVYLSLKEETFWREKKLKMQTRLKNQIKARLNKIYPGLMSKYKANKPLFSDLWNSQVARGLIRSRLTPAQIQSMNAGELIKQFKKRGCSHHPTMGRKNRCLCQKNASSPG